MTESQAPEAFMPRDPDYQARARSSFDRQRVMHTLGIRIRDLAPGRIELEMPFAADYTQPSSTASFMQGLSPPRSTAPAAMPPSR